ncbi:MAG: T9SS type A sorting domain-containing protein [Bacteroidales bacterium]|nr:T9SS type A sorting domain-containing protein [Bacteroidales bacterium]
MKTKPLLKVSIIAIFTLIFISSDVISKANKNVFFQESGNNSLYQFSGSTHNVSYPDSTKVRSCTHKNLYLQKFQASGQAENYYPPSLEQIKPEYKYPTNSKGWELVDSININSYIHTNKHIGIEFNSNNKGIQIISNFNQLCPEAISAIEKSPVWIQPALESTLSQLPIAQQQVFANIINNAQDPYIDEIAFCIAHSSPQYLTSSYCIPEIFLENALLIYKNDSSLSYVEIIDYGNSITDKDYYTTAKYWKLNSDSVLVQVEIPKEIYYWYIVHLKITDEIPAYINPNIVESNSSHSNNIASPPTGKFWRDYLFNYADAGYPVLKDMLSNCTIVWDSTSAVDSTTNHVIAVITEWVKQSLGFTSNNERPHQPVRIYKKHIGRCGEHADFTVAAARAALIPSTSILCFSVDHTWNEFWEEGWFQWEPVNTSINRPLTYENGWGWSFGSVFEVKSNGLISPVTPRYSEGISTINVFALDNNNQPIDGAKIIVAVQSGADIFYDSYGFTDNEGKYTFTVGEDRKYYCRLESSNGNFPTAANTVTLLVSNSIHGQTYNKSLKASGIMPANDITQILIPADTIDDYKLLIQFNTPNQIIKGKIWHDDIDNSLFYDGNQYGLCDFFITDSINYDIFVNDQAFDAFHHLSDVDHGSDTFNIPIESCWYALFNNGNNLNNPQHVSATAYLFNYDISSITEKTKKDHFHQQNYPNPFINNTTIAYTLETPAYVKLEITDKYGKLITTLVNQKQERGNYSILWNAVGITSGIYFCRLTLDDKAFVKKIVKVK